MVRLKIAVLGGSFNPPTFAHMGMTGYLLRQNKADVLLHVPCGFRKDKLNFALNKHRLNMLRISLKDVFATDVPLIDTQRLKSLKSINSKILIDTYELNNFDSMVPTAYLFDHYEKKYPDVDFHFVIGSDLLDSMNTWEEYDEKLKYKNFIIFERGAYRINRETLPQKSEVIYRSTPSYVSSTQVRRIISEYRNDSKQIRSRLERFVSKGTIDYIIEHELYI